MDYLRWSTSASFEVCRCIVASAQRFLKGRFVLSSFAIERLQFYAKGRL